MFDPDALDRRDVRLIRALLPLFELYARRYVRLRVDGLEHVPSTPAIFAANHNGGIAGPDLPCTLSTLWRARGADAPLYALAHDFAMRQLTPLGRVLQRLGAVRASPENARRVLDAGGQVLVYPGGDLDAYRHSRDRDRVMLGERTGFVRIAQDARAPIIPVVAYGAHRSAWILSDGRGLARALHLPRWGRLARFPIAIALPWGVGLGPWTPYLPLPFPIRLRILPPIAPAAADDPTVVLEVVRSRMQAALDGMAAEARA
ncbi:MAG TPA: lysophospholipid acyltransferase family protein [Kofleriaceae bacterium]|nr:lysophospholipid acyltransferase family protein [Kofleriaceae bacterium]